MFKKLPKILNLLWLEHQRTPSTWAKRLRLRSVPRPSHTKPWWYEGKKTGERRSMWYDSIMMARIILMLMITMTIVTVCILRLKVPMFEVGIASQGAANWDMGVITSRSLPVKSPFGIVMDAFLSLPSPTCRAKKPPVVQYLLRTNKIILPKPSNLSSAPLNYSWMPQRLPNRWERVPIHHPNVGFKLLPNWKILVYLSVIYR